MESGENLEQECPVCQTKDTLARVRLAIAEYLEASTKEAIDKNSGIRQVHSAVEKINLISDAILNISKCECAEEKLLESEVIAELSDEA